MNPVAADQMNARRESAEGADGGFGAGEIGVTGADRVGGGPVWRNGSLVHAIATSLADYNRAVVEQSGLNWQRHYKGDRIETAFGRKRPERRGFCRLKRFLASKTRRVAADMKIGDERVLNSITGHVTPGTRAKYELENDPFILDLAAQVRERSKFVLHGAFHPYPEPE